MQEMQSLLSSTELLRMVLLGLLIQSLPSQYQPTVGDTSEGGGDSAFQGPWRNVGRAPQASHPDPAPQRTEPLTETPGSRSPYNDP